MAEPSATSLSWSTQDIEQRLGFRGGRHTQVNYMLTFLLGMGMTLAFYGLLLPFDDTLLATMFTQRGPTPYVIVVLGCWSAAILLVKWRKLAYQRRSLEHQVVPEQHDFVLSSATVEEVLDRIQATVDNPRQFVLFNRICIALSNLRNLGRVSDVDEILRSQAEQDESAMETSYSVVAGFVWAIPVLGFIGTVLGLSEAIGAFGGVLGSAVEVAQIHPPFGINLYALSGIGRVHIGRMSISVIPYIVMMIGMMFAISIFPQIVTWLPGTMR